MDGGDLPESYQEALSRAAAADSDIVLLLGQTGGGKSSIANTIIGGSGVCKEGSGLRSVTYEVQVEVGRWFGTMEPVTVIDTPGFLDSEGRDTKYISLITDFLKHFPRDKLRLVIITLPLMETRAKSTYVDVNDTIELLLGEKVWDHCIFITTLQNQLNEATARPAEKIEEWKEWLDTKCGLKSVHHCNYLYRDPRSLEPARHLFLASKTFTPETSEKIDAYLASNPSASVAEVIQNVENTNKLKAKFEEQIAALIKDKEETIQKLEAQGQLSQRLQNQLESAQKEHAELRNKFEEDATKSC